MPALFWIIGILVLLVLIFLFLIAPAKHKNEIVEKLATGIYAHRGLHDLELGVPENSLAAIQRALDHGYGSEFDVHLAADGSMVVIHDDDVHRVTGGTGKVSEMTREQIDQLCLHGTEEKIPSLQDVLDLVNGKAPLVVELKADGNNAAALCEGAFALLDQYKGIYVIESFDPRVLAWVRKHRPEVGRGQLATAAGPNPMLAFLLKNLLLNVLGRPHFISYEYDKMARVPSNWICWKFFGCRMYVWTVPTQREQERFSRKEVSSIFEGYVPKL